MACQKYIMHAGQHKIVFLPKMGDSGQSLLRLRLRLQTNMLTPIPTPTPVAKKMMTPTPAPTPVAKKVTTPTPAPTPAILTPTPTPVLTPFEYISRDTKLPKNGVDSGLDSDSGVESPIFGFYRTFAELSLQESFCKKVP